MLNPELRLNQKLFMDDVEQAPIRKGFGEGLAIAGEARKNIVALCADLTESTQMHLFKQKFPERFVEIGVAEQNLVTVASGMAAMGKLPFVSSYAMFSPGRNWEQIRTTIAYNDQKVIVVGSHAGISVGPDGGTHQAIEDIALMRIMPRMAVVSPCDAIQAKKATLALGEGNTAAYLRLAREKTPIITTEETPFEIGKGQIFYRPDGVAHVAIIATGSLVHQALLAARDLEKKGMKAMVVNIHTIKPLDTELVSQVAKEARAVVTVEEHQVAGGLGSAVSEFLSETISTPIAFVGVRDEFGQSGTMSQLIEHYKLGREAIKHAVEKVLSQKIK